MTKLPKTGNSSPQYLSVPWEHDVDWALELGFCGDGETSVVCRSTLAPAMEEDGMLRNNSSEQINTQQQQ